MSIASGIIITILSIILAFQNADFVFINFFNLEIETSLSLLILLSLIVGFIIAVLFITPLISKTNYSVKNLKKEMSKLKSRANDVGIVYESEGLGEAGEYKGGKKE